MSNEEVRVGFLESLKVWISVFVLTSPILTFVITNMVLEWNIFQTILILMIQVFFGVVLLTKIVVPYMNKMKMLPSPEEIKSYTLSDWVWSFVKNLGILFGFVAVLSPPVTLLYCVGLLEMTLSEAMRWFWIHAVCSTVVGTWFILRFRRRIRESSDISIVGS